MGRSSLRVSRSVQNINTLRGQGVKFVSVEPGVASLNLGQIVYRSVKGSEFYFLARVLNFVRWFLLSSTLPILFLLLSQHKRAKLQYILLASNNRKQSLCTP